MFYLTTALVIIIFNIILWVQHINKRKRHPPGPLGLPLVGLFPFQFIMIAFAKYLPKVSDIKYFQQMRKTYGDYWSAEMGGLRIVTLASFDIVTEAFVNNGKMFAARPNNEAFKLMTGFYGIIFSNGKVWEDNREVGVKAMRKMGMGRKELENHICDEGNDLIKFIAGIKCSKMKTSDLFSKAVSNVISRLVFNESDNYGDSKFEVYIKNLDIAAHSQVINTKCALFPKFSTSALGRYIFSDVDEYYNAWRDMNEFVHNKCKKRLKIQEELEAPECVFDSFWQSKHLDNPDMGDEEKTLHVFVSMSDLYLAGSETTNNLTIFACIMLGLHQDIQHDLRKEITAITENYQQINMEMKKQCPRLLSFIDEIQRYNVLVPKPPRRVVETFNFNGFTLYPDDIVFADWGTISKDPTLFPNPDVFDPYRFMDEAKTKYVPNKHSIPFGIGKRVCIGESITIMESFLFLSRIIYNFHITLPKETLEKVDDILEGHVGLSHCPMEHELIFTLVNPNY